MRELFGTAVQDKARADLGPTGSIDFRKTAGAAEPIAIATIDSGAIVATSISEVETTKPADPRAFSDRLSRVFARALNTVA